MPAAVGRIEPEGIRLTEALSLWAADMERRGCTRGSIRRFEGTVRRCWEHAGWDRTGHVAVQDAIAWLAEMRRAGWSGPTHDGAVSALRSFSRFLHITGTLATDRLAALETCGEQGDEGARALTTDEARAVIAAAFTQQRRDGRCRINRALFYGVLCYTGLRYGEAGRCRWSDVDLDGTTGPPAIYTAPEWSKNGRRMRVCLAPPLIPALREHRQRAARTALIFPSVPNRSVWQVDRKSAGVAAEDARGRGASYHSLRKWLASELDRLGVTPGVVARILRHAQGITQARYIDPAPEAEVLAVQRLPDLWPKLWNGNERIDLTDGGTIAEDDPSVLSNSLQSEPLAPRRRCTADEVFFTEGTLTHPLGSGERPTVPNEGNTGTDPRTVRPGNGHSRSTDSSGRDAVILSLIDSQRATLDALERRVRAIPERDGDGEQRTG